MRRGIVFGAARQDAITRSLTLFKVAVVGLVAANCAPVVKVHGYLPKAEVLESLDTEEHSQSDIERLMGSPSAVSTFDQDTWYYINSIHHTYAWKAPVVVSRQIVAVRFDKDTKMVSEVDRYSVKDGRIIAFASDRTPTKGRELSFLEQLLGNVGRVSTETFDDSIKEGGR